METGTDGQAPPSAILTPLFSDWWPTTHSKSTDLKISLQKRRWSKAFHTRRQDRWPLGDILFLWLQTTPSTEIPEIQHLNV